MPSESTPPPPSTSLPAASGSRSSMCRYCKYFAGSKILHFIFRYSECQRRLIIIFDEMISKTLFFAEGRRGGSAEDRGHNGGAAGMVEEGEGEADGGGHRLPQKADGQRGQQVGNPLIYINYTEWFN